jgi:glycosyltransferase involved in cell wall biosynthesis
MLEPWALNYKKWKKKIAWHFYQGHSIRTAMALHATAESEAIQFRKLGFNQPIFLVSNGVGFPGNVTHNSEVSATDRTAIFIGRIHPIKGLPLLMKAWARVQPAGWRMRVIGPDDGNHRGDLQRQARALGISKMWTFEHAMDGVEKWTSLQSADLFILPTHGENFGISVAEAMICGLPVITTHAAPWRVLAENECGWWVPGDVDGIANALAEATSSSREELEAIGARAQSVAQERFSWQQLANEMLSCYDWLLNGGAAPKSLWTA